jgi:hypothetical protein
MLADPNCLGVAHPRLAAAAAAAVLLLPLLPTAQHCTTLHRAMFPPATTLPMVIFCLLLPSLLLRFLFRFDVFACTLMFDLLHYVQPRTQLPQYNVLHSRAQPRASPHLHKSFCVNGTHVSSRTHHGTVHCHCTSAVAVWRHIRRPVERLVALF